MIEGCPPFPDKRDSEVPKLYAAGERPPFKAPLKRYANGLKEWVLSTQANWFKFIMSNGKFLVCFLFCFKILKSGVQKLLGF